MHMGGRIGIEASGRRDKEFLHNHSTHNKLVLPHNSQLTTLVALNAHQRHQRTSLAFVKLVLNQQLYIPRTTATIKSVLSKCTVCLLARNSLNRIDPPTGNVKAFRIPHSPEENGELNKPYRVTYYDFKGPIRVRDDRSFKNVDKNSTQPSDPQMPNIYILAMTCALTRHITFEVCENRSYQSTKLAIQRILFERGTSKFLSATKNHLSKH